MAEGGRATYTVALVTEPSGGDGDGRRDERHGPERGREQPDVQRDDWSTAQTVEVTAGEDPDGTDDSETLTHTATGADYGREQGP